MPSEWLPIEQRLTVPAPTETSSSGSSYTLGQLQATITVIAAVPTAVPTPQPSPTPPPGPSATPSPAYFPTPTLVPRGTGVSALAGPWALRGFTTRPGDPQPYLDGRRLVTFYGNPHTALMGVLGAFPRDELPGLLLRRVSQYQRLSPSRTVLPAFQIISTVADGQPGPYGLFNNWLEPGLLNDWIGAARQANVVVILDIQPGQSEIQYEFERIKHHLYEPHVHLAIDAEFTMSSGQVPGQVFGRITGEQINAIQAQLNEIALEVGLNKVLIIHQFEDGMVRDKEQIVDYPYVDLVFDADGYGTPGDKSHDYLLYAGQPAFDHGGIKLFFLQDEPLMEPAEVMALEPPPDVIIYQ